MANTPGGIARTVGLWTLVVAASGSATIDFFKGNTQWAWVKVMIAVLIILHEIHRYLTHGETISTKYKKFIQKHPFWGYTSLALFGLALAGLLLHLAVW